MYHTYGRTTLQLYSAHRRTPPTVPGSAQPPVGRHDLATMHAVIHVLSLVSMTSAWNRCPVHRL